MKNTKSTQNDIVFNTRSIWINLTNGLEWLGDYRFKHEDFGFVRIPSTWCEQKLFWKILETLPPEFYLTAAQGKVDLTVLDASKHTESRALWQGCAFVEYAINRCWTGYRRKQIGRNKSADKYFDHLYRNLPRSTKAVLKYYKKFVPRRWQDNGKFICMIYTDCIYTEHDGDYKYFVERLRKYLTNIKEIKMKPKIKFRIMRSKTSIAFVIDEMDERARGSDDFEASNGVIIKSGCYPDISANQVYIRGDETGKDHHIVVVNASDYDEPKTREKKIVFALKEWSREAPCFQKDYEKNEDSEICFTCTSYEF